MTRVLVDGNTFDFDASCLVEKYDDWTFYRKRIMGSVAPGAATGCDLVVVSGSTLYLIEAKDYTNPPGTRMPPIQELAARVSTKGLHTLAGLLAGARRVDLPERDFCRAALSCTRIVLCLAMEPPGKANGWLWSEKILSDVATVLRRRVRFLDARPIVLANRSSHHDVPWTSHR